VIIGIGVDLIELDRVARLLERYGDRFVNRILTDDERATLHGDRVAYMASRLACKEAAFKALGTGWGMGVTWRQIEIRRAASGAPQLFFQGAARLRLAECGMTRAHVTLTHTRAHASAVVVLEGETRIRGEAWHGNEQRG
jgi:holo-[acyl-carrier protein] synthase